MFKRLFGEKPTPTPEPVGKTAAQIEDEEAQAWLQDIAKKAIAAGALPDESTAEQRRDANETHAGAGKAWAETHRYIYDEQTASNGARITPAQELNILYLERQILTRQEAAKRRR